MHRDCRFSTAFLESSNPAHVALVDGRNAFDMRFWDVLDQQLRASFHDFGVADGTDLRTVKVLEALRTRVGVRLRMRAFGFSVSVAHAGYMAQKSSIGCVAES